MINRSSVVIRFKQPYVDWASSLEDDSTIPDLDGEPSLYLLPEFTNMKHALELLRQGYQPIFDNELNSWYRLQSAWPKNRSFAMFCQWFDFTFVSLIEDLYDWPLKNLDADVPQESNALDSDIPTG